MSNHSSTLRRLHEINAVFSHHLKQRPLKEAFRTAFERLLGLFDVDHATVTVLDQGRQFFQIEAEYPQLSTPLVGEQIFVQDRDTQLDLLSNQVPIIANTLDHHPLVTESTSFSRIVSELDIQSVLIVPIVTNGRTVGTVSLDSIGRTKCFSDEDIELCRTVANYVAVVIANDRLREEQRRYQRQAALLAQANDCDDDEEELAKTFFEKLQGVVEFKKASLQLIIEGRRRLVGAFGFNKFSSPLWCSQSVDDDLIVREVVRSKTRVILPDTNVVPGWGKQNNTADVNSWMCIPLVFRGETIAIVTLDHEQRGYYANLSEHVLNRLDIVADDAAPKLRDIYNLEVARRQIQALEITRQFAETSAATLDPGQSLSESASFIRDKLKCTRSFIFLSKRTEQGDVLVCEAACPKPPGAIPPLLVSSDATLCPIQAAFSKAQVVLVDDVQDARHYSFTHDGYQGVRSLIAAPLRSGDRVTGVILMTHERPGWFSRADSILLETLTRQASLTIERNFGLDLVHSISKNILGATEVGAVLEQIVSGAMELTRTDSSVIYQLSEDYTSVAKSYKAKGSFHPMPRLDNPGGITRTVISEKHILEIDDIEKDPRVNPDLRGKYRSMFAIPLMLNESVIGVLYLNGKTVRKLTAMEYALLSTLAGQAALAILRARLYEQIKDSEAMYRSLFNTIPQAVCWKDVHSQFTWANVSFCRSLNARLEDVVGKTDYDFYFREDAAHYIRDDEEVMRTKQPKVIDEKNQPCGVDSPMWVRVVKTPVFDAAHQVKGMQAIFWDITEEKQLSERWQSLVEQSPDSIVIHQDGDIAMANPSAARLFGVASPEALKGRSILEFIDESSRKLAEERLEQIVKKQDVAPMVEMRVRRTTGELVDVEVYTRYGPQRKELQVLFHDITRTRTLLREMHHRVRRSFNQVIGILDQQEEFTQDNTVLRAFDTIRGRVQAMALVHCILYATRKESDVEMEQYLSEVIKAVLDGHGFSGRVDVDFSVHGIVLDENRATACGLIVNELVSNSLLHAFPPDILRARGARMSVALSSNGDEFQLVACDNGCGFSGLAAGSGDGMGLSLVRSLVVDNLKGGIRIGAPIDLDASGPGTCVTIAFPRTPRRKVIHGG